MNIQSLGIDDIGQVQTPAGSLRYVVRGSGWRFQTLLTKEPETIEWIDEFAAGDTLWDVGANVGIYSLYAALRGHRVIAFEPHFANYFQLCANVMLNGLQDRITPLCLALTDTKRVSTINLANIDFGSSMSSFGNDLDYRGRPYEIAFRQGMVGYDLDGFLADFSQDVPQHIKIDVDGIELDIARGGKKVLAHPGLKSVSIELVDTDANQVAGVNAIMSACGLDFIHKKQNPIYNNTPTGDVLNFLFRRRNK